MFGRSIPYYDAIYSFKDYATEARLLRSFIQEAGIADGSSLLDVACGTAEHLRYLSEHYQCDGIDQSKAFLSVARSKVPDASFYTGDMRTFDLEGSYDVSLCLFSSIGYMTSEVDVETAIRNIAAHVKPGGLLIVEPWLDPSQYKEGVVSVLTAETADTKIVRMTISHVEGSRLDLEMQYLVGDGDRIEHFAETHDTLMIPHDRLVAIARAAGIDARYDSEGLTGRGLIIGKRRR